MRRHLVTEITKCCVDGAVERTICSADTTQDVSGFITVLFALPK